MSAITKSALDDALAAHIADESHGALVTGYALYASTQTLEHFDREATGYFAEYAQGQAHHVAIGLVSMHSQRLDYDLAVSWEESDD